MTDNKRTKIELKIFTANYVDSLYRKLREDKWLDNYKQASFPAEEEYPKGNTGIMIDKDFQLDPKKSDLDNSIVIFEQIKLTPIQASDQRLWTYLTHVQFWDYMRERWPVEKSKKNKIKFIASRYFLRGLNLENLVRNGISRLWWYAYLTHDGTKSDKYELTKVLLSRADLTVGVTERALGSNSNILRALLEFLKENADILNSQDKTRQLLVNLNLVGGVKNLPFLEVEEIKELLSTLKPPA